MKGEKAKKEILLQYIQEAIENTELKKVRFGCAEPTPSFCVPFAPYSRINIQLKGKIVVYAAYDGKMEEKEFSPGDILFTGNKGWAIGMQREPFSSTLSIVFMQSYIRVVYVESGESEIIYNPWHHTSRDPKGISLCILQALNELMHMINSERTPRAIHLIKALLYQVAEELKNDIPCKEGKAERTFQLLKEFVHQNYFQPVNRESICQELGINPCYASTLFKKRSGESFNSYLNRIRMENAKSLLENNESISIDQTARQCGFSSMGYFIKAFKKFHGVTPGAFKSNFFFNN